MFMLCVVSERTKVKMQDNRDKDKTDRWTKILPAFGLLHGVRWFKTDVSGLPIGPIFKGQACPFFGHFDS